MNYTRRGGAFGCGRKMDESVFMRLIQREKHSIKLIIYHVFFLIFNGGCTKFFEVILLTKIQKMKIYNFYRKKFWNIGKIENLQTRFVRDYSVLLLISVSTRLYIYNILE